MEQVFAVEQDQQEANQKRPRHVDEKRGERKPAVVMLVHGKTRQITREGPHGATSQHEQASDQQGMILALPPEGMPDRRGTSRLTRPNCYTCGEVFLEQMASKKGALEAGAYGRADIRRIAGITERQLRAWEKQGLIAAAGVYRFSDLLAIQTLRKLRELRIPAAEIQRAIASLRKQLRDVHHPLSQLRITAEGRKIAVYIGDGRMEPVTGQWLLDFDAKAIEKLRSFPRSEKSVAEAEAENLRFSEHWFSRGLTLEETGAPVDEAVAAYQKAVEYNPKAPGALVNLGTIAFRSRRMKEALDFYERAMAADPGYPLAHFNLGNLFDEQGLTEDARRHYLGAIRLNPRYADAYFNLALLCERNNELLQATGYWQTYLKLDPVSAWASTARKQLDRLKRTLRSK